MVPVLFSIYAMMMTKVMEGVKDEVMVGGERSVSDERMLDGTESGLQKLENSLTKV